MFKKLGVIFFMAFILLTNLIQVQADSVSINVQQDDLLDVVLTVGKTNSTLSTFESDLTNALVNKGVPLDKLKIQAVQSSNVSAGNTSSGWEIYDHTNYNDSSVIQYYRPYYNEVNGNFTLSSHISVSTTSGTDIMFKGYGAPAYKDFMVMPNSDSGKKTFDFTIVEGVFYDALDGAGFLFNTKMTTDLATRKMSGYLMFFEYASSSASNVQIKLYKFKDVDVNTFHNSSGTSIQAGYTGFTQIASFPVSATTTRKVKIEATSTNVSVWYNDSLVTFNLAGGGTSTSVGLSEDFGAYGFGPLVGYLSHGCAQPTSFTFNDVTMTTESTKRFSEVIREPEWRNESKRFIINAEDGAVSDFSDPIALGEILARLGNEGIHYLGWGNNDADGNAFIQKNNNMGIFIDKDNSSTDTYTEQVNALAQYIYDNYVESVQNNTDYLIYGKPSQMTITPESSKNNTIDQDWPSGKWRINHDENYYTNSTGIVPYDDLYLNNLDISFTETGKYDVYFKDVLLKTVYVHRKPIAKFGVVVNPDYSVTITDTSYDPDRESEADKGIKEVNWSYKKTSDSSWTFGKPTSLLQNQEYIIQLVVVDEYGVQSNSYSRYVSTTTATQSTPVAEFKITPDRLLTYLTETVSYEDTSYDPKGSSISERLWTITKDGVEKYTGGAPKTNFTGYGAGNYKITLKVKNANNVWSEEVSRSLTIVRDTTPIVVTSNTTNSSTFYQPKSISLSFADEVGGSGFKNRYVVVTTSSATPSAWGSMGTNSSYTYLLDTLGTNYLHYKAYDYAGNLTIGYVGPFTLVDNEAPTQPTQTSTPAQGTNEWSKASILVEANGSIDNFTPEEELIYEVKVDSGSYTTSRSVTLTTQGSHVVTFRVKDSTGNTSTLSAKTYNIDLTTPSTPTKQITNSSSNYVNGEWSRTSTTLTLSASTDTGGSGLKEYQYKVDDNDWQTGSTLVLNQSGIFNVLYRSVDNAGNYSSEASVEIKVDLIAPTNATITTNKVITPGAWYNESITFNASDATDNLTLANALNYYVSIDGGNYSAGDSYSVNTNGSHTVQFKVVDEAGNSSVVSSSVNIDLTAPTTPNSTLTSNGTTYISGSWASKPVTLNLDGSTDTGGSELKSYLIKIDDESWQERSSIIFNTSGEHTVHYRSIDNAGNVSDDSSALIKLDLEASGEPTISFSPEYTSLWSNQDTTISAGFAVDDITEDDLLIYQVSLDGINYTDGKEITLSENGDYTVYFKVIDNGQNETVVSRVFKLDKSNPNVPIATLSVDEDEYIENTWINKEVTIAISNPSDVGGSGLLHNQMKINDGEWQTLNTLTFNESGIYTVYYKSVDNAGNESSVESKTIKVDFEKPEMFTIDTEITSVDKISVSAHTQDSESGLADNAYRVFNGSTWSEWQDELDLVLQGYHRSQTVELKVEVKDKAGNIQIVTKEVTTLNNTMPDANDDEYSIDEDKVLLMDVILNDIDVDLLSSEGDELTILSVSVLSKTNAGKVEIVNNELRYTPTKDFNGSFTFTYILQDSMGAQSEGLVTIEVVPVNDLPVALNDSSSVLEDQSVQINVLNNDSDIDGSLKIVSTSAASNGQVLSNGSTITYVPNANFFGKDSFTYTVSDGSLTTSASVSIDVISVNDKPSAKSDQTSTAYEKSVLIDVLVNDTDSEGDKLNVISVSSPSNGKATIVSNQVQYQPNDSFVGVDTFTVTISDGKDQATSTITIVVDKPEFSKESTSTELPSTDDKNDPKIKDNPKNGEVEIAGETVYYTPKPDFTGIDTYIIEVVEDGETVEYKYITKVEDGVAELLGFGVNIQDENFKLKNDETLTFDLDALLEEAIDLKDIEITVQPSSGKVEVVNGKLVYTPNKEYVGSDGLVFTVNINGRATPLAAVIEVGAADSKPLFTVFCYAGWIVGAILLFLIHRKTNPLFDKTSKTIIYVIQGVVALLSVCLVRYHFGYPLSISFYVIYFVGLYILLNRELNRVDNSESRAY